MSEAAVISPAAPASAMLPRVFEVVGRQQELADTATLEMRAEGGDGFAFAPGQFTMLYAHGVGEIAISISGDPARPERLTQTVRGVGCVSRAVAALGPGARVGVRGPYGVPWPVERAVDRHLVVVAGGIGLAPARPVVAWALANRDRIRSLTVVCGARSPGQILYPAELAGWAGLDRTRVLVTVDVAGEHWGGRVGVVTGPIPEALSDPARTVAMVCGPEIMMRFAAGALATHGVPEGEIFLSLERNMKCGVGWCGHCQMGPLLLCRDGPVVPWPLARGLMKIREL